MALLVLGRVGLCVGQNQMCHLCGWHFLCFQSCLYAAKIRLSFCRLFCLFTMNANGYVYETFGISKHIPVKLQLLLIRAETFDNPLTAKCFIYDVVHWRSFSSDLLSLKFAALYCLPCVGTDTLLDKFWSCGWLFVRLGNVCGCEAWAVCFIIPVIMQLSVCKDVPEIL